MRETVYVKISCTCNVWNLHHGGFHFYGHVDIFQLSTLDMIIVVSKTT